MHKWYRAVTLLLALCLLLAALPAAATAETAVLKQTSAKVKLLSEAKSGAKAVLTLQKNDVVLAYGATGSYTRVEAYGKTGYVETRRLKSVTDAANVRGVARTGPLSTIYRGAGEETGAASSLEAGGLIAVLCKGADWVAVKQGSTVGCIARSALEVFDAASPAQAHALVKKSVGLYAGAGKGAKKLATVSKGELVEILMELSSSAAIARKGNGTVGLVSLSDATVYGPDSAAVGTVELREKATIYRGAGSKMTKLGTAKKGAVLDRLGAYGDYTLVRVNGGVGCIATKLVRRTDTVLMDENHGGDTGHINTSYVEFAVQANAYAYPTKSSQKYGTIPAGSIVRCHGTTLDNLWVQIQVDSKGNRGYVERSAVRETSYTEASGAVADAGSEALTFISIMNGYRKSAGVSELKVSSALMSAAAIRAQELTRRFSHTRPDGTDCNTVDPANIFGENIAMGITIPTPEAAAKTFMGSAEHKENALRKNFTKTGAAYVQVGDNYYWVQLFG